MDKRKILYIVIGLVIGILISGSLVYAVNIASSSVSYTKSGSSVSTVEGALNELYTKSATSNMCIVTRAGESNWYAKYVCDGNVGTMKECYYSETQGLTDGGHLCDGATYYKGRELSVCADANMHHVEVDCVAGSYSGHASIINGGNMPLTISCSC